MTTRANQRARTRRALVDAAATLLEAGNPAPSMEEVAEAALVSRATAYRYFDSVQDVIWQVAADRSLAPLDEAFAGTSDIVERVLIAEEIINGFLFGDPHGARAFERAALDRTIKGQADTDARPGRRMIYIDAALEPIAARLPDDDLDRLRHALALTMGAQSVVALLDTCGLTVERAREITRFAARAVVVEALAASGVDVDAAAAAAG